MSARTILSGLVIVAGMCSLALAQSPDKAKDPKDAPIWSLDWDADWVTAVSFVSPTQVAAGNNLGQILVWNLPTDPMAPAPPPTRSLVGHTNVINRLRSTPDGRWLLSVSNDHTVRYWDMQAPGSGSESIELNSRARREAVERKRKAPEPRSVTVTTQSADRILKGHRDWVLGLSLTPNGETLATGDDKGEIVVWDRLAGTEKKRWKATGWIWALALSPDASLLAASERRPLVFDSGRHRGLNLWDVDKAQVRHDLSKSVAKEQMTGAAAFSPDGKILAVGRGGEVDGANGKITFLDPSTGNKIRELSPGHVYGVTDLDFSPDGKRLYSSGRDTVVRIWNVEDGKLLQTLGQPRGGQFKDWIHAVSVSPDGKRLAAADMAGHVHIWPTGQK